MERISFQEVPAGMFEHLRAIENYIENSGLNTHLIKLVKLRVSQINGCAYCVDMHHKELRFHGETDLRLSSLCVWEETSYFSEKERATLAFAEALTQISHKPIPEVKLDALTSFFDISEIAYLALAITQINSWNRLMKTFGISPGNYKVEKIEQQKAA